MTLVAGIDSSTQSCKVSIVDAATGAVVRSGRASHPDGTEVDPRHWWEALLSAIEAAGGLGDVSALSIGGQQHGMVALDSEGRVIRDALLWNDTRSASSADDLIAEIGAAEYVARTGSVPVASFTATKLRWLRDHEPSNATRVAAVALPHDWLTWRMLGYGPASDSPRGPDLAALTTDRSDASGTAYWSAVTGEYDRELFVAALGHDAVLPQVLGPSERAGVTVGGVDGVNAGIVVAAGAGDNAAAALGLGAAAGDVVVSIGTSGTVAGITESPAQDSSGTVAGFADATGLHLPLIATLNAARILDSMREIVHASHDELGELALAAEPGAGGLVLQPYFAGERTPNLPDATATMFGMTLESATRANFARAAFEGLLCGLADGLDAVAGQGVIARRILMVGGAAQNPATQQIAAQVFELPVVIPMPGEYVARGAAAQAAWALTGSLPSWPLSVVASLESDHRPVIRAQYASHRAGE